MCYNCAMEEFTPERVVKAAYRPPGSPGGPHATLIEGEDLTNEEILDALRGHLGREPTAQEQARVVFYNENGEHWRRWRFIGETARAVDRTIYL